MHDREWPCGHIKSVECHLNPVNHKCDVRVNKSLACGHEISLKCSDDRPISTILCKQTVSAVSAIINLPNDYSFMLIMASFDTISILDPKKVTVNNR